MSLERFTPINLDELQEVLMDRHDRKYLLRQKQVPALLEGLENQYQILQVDGRLAHDYETIYLDTPGYCLYKNHHNGKAHRFKLRFRRYVHSGLTFFEIKAKNNKSRTLKTRMPCNRAQLPLPTPIAQQVREQTGINPETLQQRVCITYRRISLIGRDDVERITIDTNVCVNHAGRHAGFGNLAVVEVKQDRWETTPVIGRLRSMQVFPGRMSKYCLALCKLEPALKHNNFKPNLHKIQKILHE